MASEAVKPWVMYFDGMCTPGPGGRLGWGFWIETSDRGEWQGYGKADARPENTSNVAEYLGLGFGLKDVLTIVQHPNVGAMGFPGLHICGDSQLVVQQVRRAWDCKCERLRLLRDRCQQLVEQILFAGGGQEVRIDWVPREQNERADALSRRAWEEAEGRPAPQRTQRKGAA